MISANNNDYAKNYFISYLTSKLIKFVKKYHQKEKIVLP
jgi:hypothetical protein